MNINFKGKKSPTKTNQTNKQKQTETKEFCQKVTQKEINEYDL